MSSFRPWLALAVGLPISALFLWLAVRNVDLGEMWDVVTAADRGLLAFGVVVVFGVYVLQGMRWRLIVDRGRPGRLRYVEIVVAGVACNNVVPGRVGELYRGRQIAIEADVPSGKGLATVLLDRVFDIVALALFLLVSLPIVLEETWLLPIAGGAVALLVAIALALAFARRYTRTRERGRRDRGLLRGALRDLLEGLATPLGRRRIAGAVLFSVLAWCAWAVAAMVVARGIGIELDVLDALFVTSVVNLGAAIPSSPGFVGTFQWLGVQSLAALGVAGEEGLAFSIVMHATWYLPTTVVGAYVLLARMDWAAFRRRPGTELEPHDGA